MQWPSTLIGMCMMVAACGDAERPRPALPRPSLVTPVPDPIPNPGGGGGNDGNGDAAIPLDAPAAAGEGTQTDLDRTPSVENDGVPSAASVDADAGASAVPPAIDVAPPPVGPVTAYLAGDSIVQTYAETASDRDQAGWGQMLGGYFDEGVTVNNRAIGGRTARRFIDEGRLDDITAELQPGDYLIVQFGTNDGNRTATYTIGDETVPYFLEPATDFKVYLQRYIDAARDRGANPVLVTPTPRNSAYCTGGNGTGAHAAAMRELGGAQAVPVVDLNARAVEHLRAICPAPSPEDFFLLRADGTVDGTHFQENGARILAGFVADGLSASGQPFAAHIGAP
jgi:lysophospholipase L1-like esterase